MRESLGNAKRGWKYANMLIHIQIPGHAARVTDRSIQQPVTNNWMEPSPSWEAKWQHPVRHPRISWNLKAHYRIHKVLPPLLFWTISIHSTPHNLMVRLYITLPSTTRSSKRSLSFRVPPQKPYVQLSTSPCMSHAPLKTVNVQSNTVLGYSKWLSEF